METPQVRISTNQNSKKKFLIYALIGVLIIMLLGYFLGGGKKKVAPKPAPTAAEQADPGSAANMQALLQNGVPGADGAGAPSSAGVPIGGVPGEGLAPTPADPAAAAAAAAAANAAAGAAAAELAADAERVRAAAALAAAQSAPASDANTAAIADIKQRLDKLEALVVAEIRSHKQRSASAGDGSMSGSSGSHSSSSTHRSKKSVAKASSKSKDDPSAALTVGTKLVHGGFRDQGGALVASVIGAGRPVTPQVSRLDQNSYAVTVRGATLLGGIPSPYVLSRIEVLPLANGDLRLSYTDSNPFSLETVPTSDGFDVRVVRGPRQLMSGPAMPASVNPLKQYVVRAALPDSAVLYHLGQQSLHTVFVGSIIPGCGQVTDIYAQTKQVQTQCGTISEQQD